MMNNNGIKDYVSKENLINLFLQNLKILAPLSGVTQHEKIDDYVQYHEIYLVHKEMYLLTGTITVTGDVN